MGGAARGAKDSAEEVVDKRAVAEPAEHLRGEVGLQVV